MTIAFEINYFCQGIYLNICRICLKKKIRRVYFHLRKSSEKISYFQQLICLSKPKFLFTCKTFKEQISLRRTGYFYTKRIICTRKKKISRITFFYLKPQQLIMSLRQGKKMSVSIQAKNSLHKSCFLFINKIIFLIKIKLIQL